MEFGDSLRIAAREAASVGATPIRKLSPNSPNSPAIDFPYDHTSPSNPDSGGKTAFDREDAG